MRSRSPYDYYDYSPARRRVNQMRIGLFWLLVALALSMTLMFIHYRANGDTLGASMIGAVLIGGPVGSLVWLAVLVLRFIFGR